MKLKTDYKKTFGAEPKAFLFTIGLYEISEIDNTLKSVLTDNAKTDFVAIDKTVETVMTIHSKKTELLIFFSNLPFIFIQNRDLQK